MQEALAGAALGELFFDALKCAEQLTECWVSP
jgi:hypothetical protein